MTTTPNLHTPQQQHSSNMMTPALSTAAGLGAARSPSRPRDEGQARFLQLNEEQDHKNCTEANKKALVQDTLAQLRQLRKEIDSNDWMFAESSSPSSNGMQHNHFDHWNSSLGTTNYASISSSHVGMAVLPPRPSQRPRP